MYGWGQNNHGQLASPKINVISQPKPIELPDHVTKSEKFLDINSIKTQRSVHIKEIFCGSRYSGLILSSGEIWMAGNCSVVSKKEENPEETKFDEIEGKDEDLIKLMQKEAQADLEAENTRNKSTKKRRGKNEKLKKGSQNPNSK